LPSTAGQQGHAQLGFQALEVEAHHRSRLPEDISGCRQRSGLDHGLEGVETIQADHMPRAPLSKYF
jgi:hypothetical protein